MKKYGMAFVLLLTISGVSALNAQTCHYQARYDLNDDCRVNLQDFALLAQDWLTDCLADPVDPACIPLDLDDDGYDASVDCDDANPNVNPAATENCSNMIDDDCDGLIDQNDPDCQSDCGDGFCDPMLGEDQFTCPEDCAGGGNDFCGDGFCDPMMGEDEFTCPSDCSGGGNDFCGDGYCDSMMGEDPFTCPEDCQPQVNCGDGICHPDEVGWCPQDCP